MRLVILALALAIAGAASAHDFWLQAAQWRLDRPGNVVLTPLIGEAAKPEPWNLRVERIVSLTVLGPSGLRDAQAGIVAGEPGRAEVMLAEPGTHVIALSSTSATSDLPAAEFNAYLAHEGLDAVAAWRAAHGAAQANGRELYARRAKALVQVGDEATANANTPIGQTLEIVPLENPFALDAAAPLSVKVLFRGRPLAGARIELESLSKSAPRVARTTDAQGVASFPLPKRGTWKLACVWSVPIANDPRADFDTLFSSLSFGF